MFIQKWNLPALLFLLRNHISLNYWKFSDQYKVNDMYVCMGAKNSKLIAGLAAHLKNQ